MRCKWTVSLRQTFIQNMHDVKLSIRILFILSTRLNLIIHCQLKPESMVDSSKTNNEHSLSWRHILKSKFIRRPFEIRHWHTVGSEFLCMWFSRPPTYLAYFASFSLFAFCPLGKGLARGAVKRLEWNAALYFRVKSSVLIKLIPNEFFVNVPQPKTIFLIDTESFESLVVIICTFGLFENLFLITLIHVRC